MTKKRIKIAETRTAIASAGTTVIVSSGKVQDYDIGDLSRALRSARDTQHPNRTKLYDLYDYFTDDPHVSSVIDKRRLAVTGCKIEFMRDGKQDKVINELLEADWFTNFLGDALDTDNYGHSLFQFYRNGDWVNYDLIPRKNVEPHSRIILSRQTDTIGHSFDEYSNMLSLGKPSDLGRLRKIAKSVIHKNNALANFAQFVEEYGKPIKEGVYDGYDDSAREKMVEDLYNMGGSAVFVHPKGTEIKLHDSASKGASATLYDSFLNFCNREISKAYLGNTLTTDVSDKGTQALGTVHQDAEDKLVASDKRFILQILNYHFIDILASLGYNVKGGKLVFVEPDNRDLTKRYSIDRGLKDMGLPIDDDYFYETYGIPKPANYNALKSTAARGEEPVEPEEEERIEGTQKEKKQSPINRIRDFFVHALGKRALDW